MPSAVIAFSRWIESDRCVNTLLVPHRRTLPSLSVSIRCWMWAAARFWASYSRFENIFWDAFNVHCG